MSECNDALHYMNMLELKQACQFLGIPHNGKKIHLIQRIIVFMESGQIIKIPIIPDVSRANGKPIPLSPRSLILYGRYKNDLATRLFMKKLIGEHFHFTAFGIDWINERWLAGNPPTYAEFAEYWIHEIESRQSKKAQPKQEWAYLNFIQWFIKEYPASSRDEMMIAWEKERLKQSQKAQKVLLAFKKKSNKT